MSLTEHDIEDILDSIDVSGIVHRHTGRLQASLKPDADGRARPVTWRGKEYPSVKAFCAEEDFQPWVVRYYLRTHGNLDGFADTTRPRPEVDP
ncbi:MAG: hypothetical protein MEQ74_11965 [Paracoccus sp.]|nr:hypothetical protein [Paracoccus sp. (in: a-proteobacteria)]